jgi:phenylacetate-CoA ligase
MPQRLADRRELEAHQAARLAALVERTLVGNRFYRDKWLPAGLNRFVPQSLDDLKNLPFTTKDELLADQERHPPYGTALNFPPETYTRIHQTSGTKGKPLRWLDTPESWEWMLGCWRQIYALAGIGAGERIFFPFSFGPFLGFWTAFDAAAKLGCLCLPGGGLSTLARLRMTIDHQVGVLCCTPTYAIHLAHAAEEAGVDLATEARVHTLIVAGEPGGNIPATRARIERAWNARVIDHSGLTEVGPLATESKARPGGLYILEADYIAEVLDPATGEPTPPGEIGELIVTNLGRVGSPLFRYRTGDLVRPNPPKPDDELPFVWLEGGILGRRDDMVPLRGNNFYPSSLEAVLRRFDEILEYRIEIDTTSPLAELHVELEPTPAAPSSLAARVAQTIRDELLFRADVTLVPPGTLPRFEMKASRVRRK